MMQKYATDLTVYVYIAYSILASCTINYVLDSRSLCELDNPANLGGA
jgi:hypothetical protein